jgi:23S rRNA pseudouridine1911/1915/1917 synthase
MPDTLLTVEAGSAGLRLDFYLAQRFGSQGLSRAEVQLLIGNGLVTVNGSRTKASVRLKANDTIRVQSLPLRETSVHPENLPLDIIYEDSHLMVINKPAGMIVHPTADRATGTLVNALLYHCPDLGGIGGERRPGIVHRLDKDTSGLIVIVKTSLAFQRLAAQFKDRTVQKEYVALVWGRLPSTSGVIDRAIGRHRSDRKRMSSRYSLAKSREAVTEWQVERVFNVGAGAASPLWVSLLRLKPRTGRTHQLRVHLADLGRPILGDKTYGYRKQTHNRDNAASSPLNTFPRQALHAERLSFVHPVSKTVLAFCAPLPQDMEDVLKFLAERNAQ